MTDLCGRRALVTGASRGIGRAIALRLAQAGADVGINYASSEEAAAETLAGVERLGRRGLLCRADVRDSEAVDQMVKTVASELGGLDILVTHASPWGIHDQPDPAHQGFRAFLPLMERFRPRYLLHGHIHLYRGETQRTQYHDTTVINAYGFQFIDIDVPERAASLDGQECGGS